MNDEDNSVKPQTKSPLRVTLFLVNEGIWHLYVELLIRKGKLLRKGAKMHYLKIGLCSFMILLLILVTASVPSDNDRESVPEGEEASVMKTEPVKTIKLKHELDKFIQNEPFLQGALIGE